MKTALSRASFPVKPLPNYLQGINPKNIINRGVRKQGLQIELTMRLREDFFKEMNRAGRQNRTPLFNRFVQAIRAGIRSLPS
ncbi:poly-gamma-glutamate hydrolase family protein [Thermoactinomyces sp. AMNI-1]|uniref:Poly-gamma-glutamate hydrolase family protein n=1 Tax=Thermoactinomyces mirandus TaxID=2756294 RepID=A0A7W1XRR4_9BACL|nr:poly-gamma-glutamate hydrolase family protein [Thermoactinomyces mirandus]